MNTNMEEYYDKIYRYCFFKLQQRETAEDVTQETFLRFLNHNDYRSIERKLPYLYRIAHNLCVDEWRKRKTISLPLEETLKDTAAEEGMFDRISVKAALEELSGEERELVLLRYVNEVPVSAICKIYGISRYAVHRKLTKAVRKLEEKLR